MQVPPIYAGVNSLGRVQRVHRTSVGRRLVAAGTIGVLLALSLAAFVASSTFDLGELGTYGKLAPLIPAAMALFTLPGVLATWNKTCVVYEHGMAFKDRRGLQTWRWADLQSFYASVVRHLYMGIIPTGTSRSYTITHHNNQIFSFDQSMASARELADAVRLGMYPYLLGRSIQAYQAGQSVQFGALAVSQQGLQHGKHVYPWPQVSEVKLRDGHLHIEPFRVRVPAHSIANLDVFLGLLQHTGGTAPVSG